MSSRSPLSLSAHIQLQNSSSGGTFARGGSLGLSDPSPGRCSSVGGGSGSQKRRPPDIDRKAVNPPRFQGASRASRDMPGPGAHDPDIGFTRSGSNYVSFRFGQDDRQRYLGRPGRPEKVIPRKSPAQNGLEEEALTRCDADPDATPPPGAYDPRDVRFVAQSLTNEFTFGKHCRGGLFPGVPRDVQAGKKLIIHWGEGGKKARDCSPRGMQKEANPASVKWSGVCKEPGGKLKTGSLSPRTARHPKTNEGEKYPRPASPWRVHPPSPLEAMRKLPWNEQIEVFERKIKEGGPLNLELHRYLTQLVSNPTLKTHKMVAEKESLKRMQDRKVGKTSNQKELLGVYQYIWPQFVPERS